MRASRATTDAVVTLELGELAEQAVAEGLVSAISSSTVRRWLHADAIKPWRYRSWIFPRDPAFAAKAARVLDLYARVWEGLRSAATTTSSPPMRSHSCKRCAAGTQPARLAPGRWRRSSSSTSGAEPWPYMGAYDVHRAHLFGTVAGKTGIVPFMDLVDQVMTTEPYASARTVYWVVDNGSSHNGQRSIGRMTEAWPTAKLVHLPIHASWLNQIEIVFSIIQRKVIKPADFADLAELRDRLERFTDRYNQSARPFDWRFTTADLAAMLDRVEDRHDELAPAA